MRRRNVKNAKQRIENHPELVIANPKEYIGNGMRFLIMTTLFI